VYGEAIKKVGADALLAARMILGCKHIKETISHSEDFENMLISLLNGAGLDVDSLDYIQRDTWSSGFTNVNIDYARLLSGISITYNGSTYKIVFNKSALNVLENIWLGRNYLYKWIYTHHKVIYEQYLLKSVVEELDVESKSEFINNIFNIQRFSEPYKMQFNGIRYYLPTDDDIITSIKQSEIKNKKAELLSRQYRFKSLWKTYFEFSEYFRDYSSIDSNDLMKEVIILLDSLNYRDSQDYIILEAKPNLKELKPNEYYIKIDKKNEIDAFYASDIKVKPVKYFYLYVNNEMLKKKAEILEKLKHINLEKPLINEEQFYCKRCKMNIDCPDREDCIKVKAPHLN
jgi:HD superfamily phosphohydrolase